MSKYDVLRQAHAEALDQLNQHLDRTSGPEREAEGPTRPERHPSQSHVPHWSGDGNLVAQQTSAARYNDAAQAHQANLHALRQHEQGQPDRSQSPEPERPPERPRSGPTLEL